MTLPAPEIRERLRAILDSASVAADQLVRDLDDERHALEAEDMDALAAAAAAKEATLGRLQALERQRRDLLATEALADDPRGMDELLERCHATPSLTGTWTNYLAMARRCNAANRVNGAIIRLRQQQIAGLLTAVTDDKPGTYGPDSGTRPSSRPIAEA